MKQTIIINEAEISLTIVNDNEFVSLSDLSLAFGGTDEAIRNWMRTRTALEVMAIWEEENNPNFNSVEFDRIKNESGKNTFAMKRDSATEDELHLLSNLETHNAEMIEAGMAQYEREAVLSALFEKQLTILKNRAKRTKN